MGDFSDEKICLCALNRIFGYAPGTASVMLDCFGSAGSIFRLGKDVLREALGPESKYLDAFGQEALDMAAKELEEAEKYGIAFIGRGEKGYPPLLAECQDAPAGLYVRSGSPLQCMIQERDYISIVGTRNISDYGREWCRRIVEALARTGRQPVIVSGLAYGTDMTAHMAALENGLDTIAVMATGADTVYPCAHRGVARKIARLAGSALISDYPLHTKAIAVNFIRRNRIIAGLGRATILVESGARGGGMITAGLAFSYDRDVYALPGRADDIMSAGCNALIRSGTAIPITSEKNLTESLGYEFRKKTFRIEEAAAVHYSGKISPGQIDEIAGILLAIKKFRRISLQELAEATGMDYKRIAGLAGILENDGFISIDLMKRCSIKGKNA